MRVRGLQSRPAPGTRVRLTGIFLKNTGQHAGSEGQSVWQVTPCDCLACRACGEWEEPNSMPLVAVNEVIARDDEEVRWRHIAAYNLEVVGAPPRAADYP